MTEAIKMTNTSANLNMGLRLRTDAFTASVSSIQLYYSECSLLAFDTKMLITTHMAHLELIIWGPRVLSHVCVQGKGVSCQMAKVRIFSHALAVSPKCAYGIISKH